MLMFHSILNFYYFVISFYFLIGVSLALMVASSDVWLSDPGASPGKTTVLKFPLHVSGHNSRVLQTHASSVLGHDNEILPRIIKFATCSC